MREGEREREKKKKGKRERGLSHVAKPCLFCSCKYTQAISVSLVH